MSEGIPVLIVERDAARTRRIENALRAEAVLNPIRTLSSVEEAIKYLSGSGRYQDRTQNPLPVGVLLDVWLAGNGAFELLDWIREQPDLEDIQVVLLSESDPAGDIRRAWQPTLAGSLN
jgi:CheY-like chemotaxis protein